MLQEAPSLSASTNVDFPAAEQPASPTTRAIVGHCSDQSNPKIKRFEYPMTENGCESDAPPQLHRLEVQLLPGNAEGQAGS
mmetsp:Transcript_22604/g.46354  ORF Transcript_22604/g.46354 Transcript_22604/m.46354 type:complete len:81 (-) Transcript_22604:15-257(-)